MTRLLVFFIPFLLLAGKPNLLLLKTYKDQNVTGCGMNEKLDGIRCQLDNGIEFKIGEMVTFQYQKFTKYGEPRFPVFLRVRGSIK